MLKRLVESRIFDLMIQGLIVASLVGLCIETLPNLDARTRWLLAAFEIIAVATFTIEYALRLLVTSDRLKFVFSFYGIVDLIAILSFLLAPHFNLLAVRALRLLRVFRVFKLLRYMKAMERLASAFREVKEELVLYIFTTFLVVFLSSVGIYHFEHEAQPEAFGSVFHCMWWAIVTLTTIGYGDVVPITVGGRIFTTVVLLSGVGIVATPAALLSSALTNARRNEGSR